MKHEQPGLVTAYTFLLVVNIEGYIFPGWQFVDMAGTEKVIHGIRPGTDIQKCARSIFEEQAIHLSCRT